MKLKLHSEPNTNFRAEEEQLRAKRAKNIKKNRYEEKELLDDMDAALNRRLEIDTDEEMREAQEFGHSERDVFDGMDERSMSEEMMG